MIDYDQDGRHQAFMACQQKIADSQPREGYCNATWDQMLCWNALPAGQVATQSCPDFVFEMDKNGFAIRECNSDGLWASDPDSNSTDGWTNYSNCFKLTDPVHETLTSSVSRIQLMSNIGYGISLVSLVVAILIMLLSRRLHCKSNSLHMNLFLAFILRASISFLKDMLFVEGLGLRKDVNHLDNGLVEFKHDGMHWECKLLVSVFIYTVSASLMWIFMEGLYLHMLVYKTLFTERTGIRVYVIIGWLSPFIYVIPWVIVRATADNTYCWNMDPYGYIWIIKGPIIVTILINFIFFINIVRVLCIRMQTHRNSRGNNQQLRKLAKFSLVLIPLFGVFYILFAAYPHGINIRADMIYLYCEMFYNSFQGIVLAILFCFLNEEVHNEIRRCWYRRRRSDNPFTRSFTLTSYRKGSCMSHTSASNGARDCRKIVQIKDSKRTDTNSNPMKTNRYQINDKGRPEPSQIGPTYKYLTHEDRDQSFPLME